MNYDTFLSKLSTEIINESDYFIMGMKLHMSSILFFAISNEAKATFLFIFRIFCDSGLSIEDN